jgi:hypothetical protein
VAVLGGSIALCSLLIGMSLCRWRPPCCALLRNFLQVWRRPMRSPAGGRSFGVVLGSEVRSIYRVRVAFAHTNTVPFTSSRFPRVPIFLIMLVSLKPKRGSVVPGYRYLVYQAVLPRLMPSMIMS